jgi:hypothetical protein
MAARTSDRALGSTATSSDAPPTRAHWSFLSSPNTGRRNGPRCAFVANSGGATGRPGHLALRRGEAAGRLYRHTPNAGHANATGSRADREHESGDQTATRADCERPPANRRTRVASRAPWTRDRSGSPCDSERRLRDSTFGADDSERSERGAAVRIKRSRTPDASSGWRVIRPRTPEEPP